MVEGLGSGLEYNKSGLREVTMTIFSREVGRIVISHKDRLLRLGCDFGVFVVWTFRS